MAELDVRGEICPYPLYETRKVMEAMPPGETLEVRIDYPLALDNIARWAEGAGHQVVETREEGPSEWTLVLKRG